MPVRVQTQDFDVGMELSLLGKMRQDTGAIVSFIGQVRDVNAGDSIAHLTLEHYPGMTEKALEAIIALAKGRWEIFEALIIHRIGTLNPTDQIVLVAVTSAHREEAFNACAFIMDYLKTDAPFWKKEATEMGERWVEARHTDEDARKRWT